jgi:hypothetical protein
MDRGERVGDGFGVGEGDGEGEGLGRGEGGVVGPQLAIRTEEEGSVAAVAEAV